VPLQRVTSAAPSSTQPACASRTEGRDDAAADSCDRARGRGGSAPGRAHDHPRRVAGAQAVLLARGRTDPAAPDARSRRRPGAARTDPGGRRGGAPPLVARGAGGPATAERVGAALQSWHRRGDPRRRARSIAQGARSPPARAALRSPRRRRGEAARRLPRSARRDRTRACADRPARRHAGRARRPVRLDRSWTGDEGRAARNRAVRRKAARRAAPCGRASCSPPG